MWLQTVVKSFFRTIKLRLFIVRLGIKSAYQYRAAFWLQVVGMFVSNAAIIFALGLLYARFGDINGWGFRDTLLVLAISSMVFGFVELLFANIDRDNLARQIVDGQLDSYMLFPQSALFHASIRRINISGIGEVCSGVVFLVLSGQVHSGVDVLIVAVGVALGVSIMVAAGILVQSLVFWYPGLLELGELFSLGTMTSVSYPEPAFRGAARFVLLGLFPALFVGFLPARLLHTFGWREFLMMLGAAVLVNVVARYVFRRGLRHYQSGNLVTTNI